PVGNGRLGAMIYGGIAEERIQLNEETVWSGKPADFVNHRALKALPQVRRLLFEGKYLEAQKLAQEKMMGTRTVPSSYQTLGDLQLKFNTGEASGYKRELDLNTAVARVEYRTGNTLYTREGFSSAPDQAIVMQLRADKPGAISTTLALSRPGEKATVEINGNELVMREHIGNGVGVKMVTRLKVI